jgi:hypothetical protein
MTDNTMIPFYKSFLLGQTVYLDQLKGLPMRDLELLNVDTLAALEEARHRYAVLEDKKSDDAGAAYRQLKTAGYFQAAIQIELGNR